MMIRDKCEAFYNAKKSLNHADSFAFICIPAMNDLMQSMVLAGGQWIGSSEHLEGPDDISTGKRRKELGSMAFSTTSINFATVNSAAGLRSKQLLNNKGIGRIFSVWCGCVSNTSGIGIYSCLIFHMIFQQIFKI